MNMKSLRISALMLALGVSSICSMPTQAQQEVDPDHFDRPIAASTHVRGAKTQGHHGVTTPQPRTNKKLAAAPSRKAHHTQNLRQTSGSSDTLGD